MPAKNPRLTITISPTLHAQLRRLSELTGNSQSALIADLLEGSGPTMKRAIKTLELAESMREQMGGSLGESLRAAQEHLETQLGLSFIDDEEVSNSAVNSLLDEAEKVTRHRRRRKARAAAPPEVQTPPSNRGVRNPENARAKKAVTRGKTTRVGGSK